MQQKRRAIIKLSFILFAIVLGLILCFVPIKIPGTFNTFRGFASDIKLGIDLKGGVYAVYEASETETEGDDLSVRLESTRKRLLDMLQSEGYMESTAVLEGARRIRIEAPDVEDPEEFFNLMGQPAEMVFRLVEGENVLGDTKITGKMVTDAYAINYEGGYGIQLNFNSEGATEFHNVTRDNVGKYISIVVNDQEVSRAEIKEAIAGGKPVISGDFTYDAANELAKKILSGAFDVKLDLVDSNVVSASLGVDALKWSLIAGIIGVLFIIAYLCCIYRGMGVIASISLLMYTALFIFLLWSFPWIQLSLPGIAGIILSLGMAVDANVIIFERIKEEYKRVKKGVAKSINASVAAGFKRSLWTVLDANITTIIASVVLIILGKGTVQGFGITLLMGIILSLFTAMLVSRGLFKIFLAINKSNDKFYGLKRGAEVDSIAPDDTDKPDKNKAVPMDFTKPIPQEFMEESETEDVAPPSEPSPEGGAV